MANQHIIHQFRVDDGSVENSAAVHDHCAQLSNPIKVIAACAKHQNQNPIERSVPELVGSITASLLDQSLLNTTYWDRAALNSCSCHNSVYIPEGFELTTINIFRGSPCDLTKEHLFKFGCAVAVVDHNIPAFKFSPNGVFGIAVGSNATGNGGTQVIIPAANNSCYLRFDCRDHKLITRESVQLEYFKKTLSSFPQDTYAGGGAFMNG